MQGNKRVKGEVKAKQIMLDRKIKKENVNLSKEKSIEAQIIKIETEKEHKTYFQLKFLFPKFKINVLLMIIIIINFLYCL